VKNRKGKKKKRFAAGIQNRKSGRKKTLLEGSHLLRKETSGPVRGKNWTIRPIKRGRGLGSGKLPLQSCQQGEPNVKRYHWNDGVASGGKKNTTDGD